MAHGQLSWRGRIESLSHEGVGVGTQLEEHEGKTVRRPVFVPLTVPGDVVEATIVEYRRKYMFATLARVIAPSPERVEPRCAHFGRSGSCSLQHVSYAEQLRQKGAQASFLLGRKGIALPRPIEVLPSIARYHYRWRSRIAVRFEGGECIAGFREQRSRAIVRADTCFLVHERICDVLALLNASPASFGGVETEVVVVVGDREKVGLAVYLDDVPAQAREDVKLFFEEVYARNRKLIGNVSFGLDGRMRSYGQVQEHLAYEAAGMRFSFLPETFIQANVPTDDLLIRTCVALLFRDAGPEEIVLDLYAGIGNLSLPIARRAARVVAVEGNPESVRVGIANALTNGIGNVTFVHHAVERYLREHVRRAKEGKAGGEYPRATAIVLDPPRTGLTPAVIGELLACDVSRVLYVSCNPVTLADDLAALSSGYALADIACVDMFPDTPHVETVALLERRASPAGAAHPRRAR